MTDETTTTPIETAAASAAVESEAPSPASTPKSKPSSARARAEARRRRILEKSKDRMSVVSGEKIVKPVSAPVSSPAPSGSDVTVSQSTSDDKSPEGENENAEAKTENAATDGGDNDAGKKETTTANKGSARLAQMRRRRYKKSTASASTASATATDASTAGGTENVAESVEKKTDESKAVEKPKTEVSVASATPVGTKDETPTEEKKYLGVVKMRRKMLAEKKAQAASKTSTAPVVSTKTKPIKREKKVISLRPIIVQLLTVLMLFLAGFDVGLQSHVIVNQEVPTIHTNLVFSDHGIGALKLVGMNKNTPSQRPNDVIIQDSFDLDGLDEDEFLDAEDGEEEFPDVKPSGAFTSPTKEPNIDPLFKVDLDELTSGPGILMTVARFAVSMHRTILYFCFTLPLSFISGLFALPKRLLANPPILFLCAVIIRYLGKHVLGGAIPDLDKVLEAEMNEMDGMKAKEGVAEGIANTDFVSMGINFVKNFAKTNFPKAVLVYTIFQDARSDMFVIFCGFFLGLVVPSNLLGHDASSSLSEEL